MISPLKPIFDEMMKPKWLHHLLKKVISHQSYETFEALTDLRKELLVSSFLHPEHESSQARQSLYWQNQIALLRQKSGLNSLQPSVWRLHKATEFSQEYRQKALEILDGFVYERDTHLELFSMLSQRNRWIYHLSRLGEILVEPSQIAHSNTTDVNQSKRTLSSLRSDLQWCLKVTLYQYRGLLSAVSHCDVSIFMALRQEILMEYPSFRADRLGLKIYIRYHQFLWDLLKNEPLESMESYVRPSIWGIIRFLWSLIF